MKVSALWATARRELAERTANAASNQQGPETSQPAAPLRTGKRRPLINELPRGLIVGAMWAVALIAVGAGVLAFGWVAGRLSEVVFPLFSAFLLTAALEPLNGFLVKRRCPAWLAALICLLFLVVVVGGLLTLVGVQIASQWDDLSMQTVAGFRELMNWLGQGPLHIGQDQINTWIGGLNDFLKAQQASIATLAASVGASIVRFLTGLIMCLFAIFFFLKDGHLFARSLRRAVPSGMR
ncbi:MAG: AI-2E family transporter, partial [Propionibacteriaceae bacterium]|nr:AI-2E family transporter [Propionibacteriaceae bacterium]